jgi:hypothetical protein
MSALRQVSTVSVGEGELTVVSEILLEPEAMMVTSVLHAEQLVRRRHAPLSPAVIDDYNERGRDALLACLHGSHLRFVRKLLSAGERTQRPTRAQMPLGIVATLVLGEEGEVLSSAGEDEIPSSWLRGVYLLSALCEAAERSFSLGKLSRASAQSASLRAVLRRNQGCTAVCFGPPSAAQQPTDALERHLEEISCGTAFKS